MYNTQKCRDKTPTIQYANNKLVWQCPVRDCRRTLVPVKTLNEANIERLAVDEGELVYMLL